MQDPTVLSVQVFATQGSASEIAEELSCLVLHKGILERSDRLRRSGPGPPQDLVQSGRYCGNCIHRMQAVDWSLTHMGF